MTLFPSFYAEFLTNVAKARECLTDARQTHGIARRVNLRSARHYGKIARLCLNAAKEAQP